MGYKHIGKYLNRILCGIMAIIMLALAAGVPAKTAKAQFQEDFAQQELILAVTKDRYILSEGIIAIQKDGNFYLPVLELAELMDFSIDVDLERGIADGWYLAEENTFSINTETNEIIHLGDRESLPDEAFIIENQGDGFGDIYVQQEILSDIWPVSLDVELYSLSLRITAEEKLPFELKLERQERQEMAAARERVAPTQRDDLPFIPNDYKIIGAPALDLDYQAAWDDDERAFTSRFGVAGTQDLLWAQADYSGTLTYNREGEIERPRNIRLRFLRQFFQDEAPLGIREIEVGDTRAITPDLVANSVSGRGISVSTRPISQDRSFDEITIEGTARAGWEIELYRNNQLIEFGVVDETGEYRFENVELSVGNNQFRIVLYGPQGQIEERTESYQINGNMLAPGDTEFSAAVVDADRPLVLLENDPRTTPRGTAQQGSFSMGATRWLTLFGTASRLPLRRVGNVNNTEDEGKYLTVGGMFTAFGGFGQVEAYKKLGSGHALDIQFATNILGVNLNLESAIFNDFESESAGFGEGAKTYEGQARASRNFKLPFGSLGLQVNIDHEERKNGFKRTQVSTRQSFSRSGVRLTHSTTTNFADNNQQNSTASISATVRMRQWQLRSGMNYTIDPQVDVTSANAEIRYRGDDSFSAAVNVQHNFLSDIISSGAQLSYDFGEFLGSVGANWQKERGVTVTLRASTSLGPFGKDRGYIMSSKKLSNTTPVKGRVFLDKNDDGVFNDGDEPLQNAKLLINGSGTQERTSENGNVVMYSKGRPGLVNVEVDKSSLVDPYFRPSIDGYSTILRQGGMPYVELPVIETGAIDGTVLRDASGAAVEGMRLELVDAEGNIVNTTETAYDGFYSFEFVPPGDYTVRADPEYGVNVPPMSVSVASDDLFAYGIDLALMEQAEEAQAAAEDAEVSSEAEATNEAASGASGGVAQTHHSQGTGQPAPLPGDGDFTAVVKRVRIGEHPDKARFVLDLSGPADYRLSCKENCKTVQVDLPNVAWSAIKRWRAQSTPVIESFETQALAAGGTRLTIKARKSMSVGLNGVLGPHENAGRGHRLYLDLQ